MREEWIDVELGDVFFTTSGGTPKRVNPDYYNGNIPWVKSGELNYNIIRNSEEYISEEALSNSSAKLFPSGTLLIALYGATIGKLAILGMPAATNQAVCGIYKNNWIETKFIYHYLFLRKQDLIKQGIGGAQPNISQTILKKLTVPICPLPEQRAIVAKIEELFSELDNCVANLNKVKEQLEIYRQAVLKKAFEGELTNSKIEHERLSTFSILITKGASPKWQGFDYTDDSSQLLFITSENVRDGYVDYSKKKYLPLSFNGIQKRSILKKGDVLFNLVGASIGRAAIYNENYNANINQAVAIIRLNESLSNTYLNYYLNSEFAKQEYLSKTVDVARANISLKDVNEIQVPYCLMSEQVKIIQEIERRLSVCDNILSDISHSIKTCEIFRQSILKKAFDGKLLSEKQLENCKNEFDWEPAEVLLEKIKNELRSAK